MVNRCCVQRCTNFNSTDHPISMHRFPREKSRANSEKNQILRSRLEAWMKAVKRKELNKDKLHAYRICGKHFSTGKPSHYTDTIHPDWVPHLFMGYSSTEKLKRSPERAEQQKLPRHQRRKEREMNKALQLQKLLQERQEKESTSRLTDSGAHELIPEVPYVPEIVPEPETGTYVQTDVTIDNFSHLQEEIHRLREENAALKTQLAKAQLKELAFTDEKDDKKLLYHTGIPNLKVYNLLLEYLNPALCKIRAGKLDNFQKLLLVLMKFRLKVSFTGLGYRFGLTVRVVSRVFQQVVLLLHHTFEYIVHWPDQSIVSKNMPACFKSLYGDRVKLIIDCFEIRSQKPSLLRSQLQSYSPYKSGHTVKYLIGITPQGFIPYISDGWGGRVSDKVVTQQCEIMKKLEPTDIVLADRGFPTNEAIEEMQARILTPAFTRNKPQLHPSEIEDTRKLASVRIHVERVIDMLRNKFRILKGPVPITLMQYSLNGKSLLDYVVYCCCILSNMCPRIVPIS